MHITKWPFPPLVLPIPELGIAHIWSAFTDCPNIASIIWVLSPDEHLRASKFKFDIHRRRFIYARATLRFILARYLNKPPEKIIFKYTLYGKPYFSDSLYFNVSHSDQLALYAISTTEKIGIDIEHFRSDIETDAIAKRFFSSYETETLLKLSDSQKLSAFFRIWTCKEAFIKAVGEGLSFPLKDFDVELADDTRIVEIRGRQGEKAEDWSLIQLTPEENYLGALAIKAKLKTLECWRYLAHTGT